MVSGILTVAVGLGGGRDGPGFSDGFILLQEEKIRPKKTIDFGMFIRNLRNCFFMSEVWFLQEIGSTTTIAPKI